MVHDGGVTCVLALTLGATMADPTTLLDQIDEKRLRTVVEKLSSFHTRNSLSTGIREACEWVAAELRTVPGLHVELMEYTLPAGRRIPKDTPCVQVVATLPGETATTVLVGGHIDSLNLAGEATTVRAPGANDDASGVALTMELARVLATQKWRNTFKFVAFSGEEQGLLGSTALAKRAKDEKWDVLAVLSNDTVGSSSNKAGQKDTKRVRVFSEEGDTHQSRELGRFIEWQVRETVKGFGVKLVFRRDRFGRGGDHTPFVLQGFNAVRFIEVHEEYTRQHTDEDRVEFMDFKYLANVVRANLSAMTALGASHPAPKNVRIVRDQSHDTSLSWTAVPGVDYVVYWRETTSPVWNTAIKVGAVNKATVARVNKDDHVFAVGSVGGVPVEAD